MHCAVYNPRTTYYLYHIAEPVWICIYCIYFGEKVCVLLVFVVVR